jgi:hypothetical protein
MLLEIRLFLIFYMGNNKDPISNANTRFANRARNETLWKPAMKAMIFKEQDYEDNCDCGNHRTCNLRHNLNNCNFNIVRMTKRRDMLQEKVAEAIRKHKKVQNGKILRNSTVNCINSIGLWMSSEVV